MKKKLVLIGANGHGKVVADMAIKNGYEIKGFLDDNESIKSVWEFPVLGKIDNAQNYKDEAAFVVSIGNAQVRKRVHTYLLQNNCDIVTLVHPHAILGINVTLGRGSVVMAGAVINPDTVFGEGCLINTGATVDHDCKLEDYVHIAVGAHVAGTVEIGQETWVGAGAVVKNNVTVCGKCMIGAGAVVVKNIQEIGTYVGVPARKLV